MFNCSVCSDHLPSDSFFRKALLVCAVVLLSVRRRIPGSKGIGIRWMPSRKNLKTSCVWHVKLCTVIPERQIFYIFFTSSQCNLLCSHFFPPGLRKQTKYRIEGISIYTGMGFGGYMIDQIHGPTTNQAREQHKRTAVKATTSRFSHQSLVEKNKISTY